jgi:hypothetical protein
MPSKASRHAGFQRVTAQPITPAEITQSPNPDELTLNALGIWPKKRLTIIGVFTTREGKFNQ